MMGQPIERAVAVEWDVHGGMQSNLRIIGANGNVMQIYGHFGEYEVTRDMVRMPVALIGTSASVKLHDGPETYCACATIRVELVQSSQAR
jgi:hypothetical protein